MDPDGNPSQIKDSSYEYVIFVSDEDNPCSSDEITPIPVTDKLLKANHWTYITAGGRKLYKHPIKNFAVEVNTDNFIVGTLKSSNGATAFTPFFRLAYLHQLQMFMVLAGWTDYSESFIFPESMYHKKSNRVARDVMKNKEVVDKLTSMVKDIVTDKNPQAQTVGFNTSMEELFPSISIPEISF